MYKLVNIGIGCSHNADIKKVAEKVNELIDKSNKQSDVIKEIILKMKEIEKKVDKNEK